MTLAAFWLYTVIVGTVFVYVLLWAIAQWLKADEESEEAGRKEEHREAA
jgi:hypothetical protein